MGYPPERLRGATAANAPYIGSVEDWILQKATKEENGEMKYFIERKKPITTIQRSILRFASIM